MIDRIAPLAFVESWTRSTSLRFAQGKLLSACRAVAFAKAGWALKVPKVFNIRPAIDADRDPVWQIFHEVVAAVDTYAFDPQMSREDALAYWFRPDTHTYVAEADGKTVGTYILRPNQSGPGSHIANAAFMVPSSARGQGVGRGMAEHCLSEAHRLGFRAMQFNFVVATNQSAIHLWQQLGFEIVGTLPGAFRHPEKGYVDVYVMFRALV